VLLVGSHYSFIDWAVLQMASPRPVVIASNRSRYERWYSRLIRKQLGMIFIDRRDTKPSMEKIKQALLDGKAVVIFPEGEVSKAPFISRFSIDYTEALHGLNVPIVPFYIYGVWGSPYSHVSDCVMFPNKEARFISVGFAKPLPSNTKEDDIREALRDLSIDVWEQSATYYKRIATLVVRAMKSRVRFKVAIYNFTGEHLSGYEFVRKILVLTRLIKKVTRSEKNVGLMFPPCPEGFASFIALISRAKTSVNLNYSASPDIIMSCIQKTEVKTVFTSRHFFEKLYQKNPLFNNIKKDCKLIFVDDFFTSKSLLT
jgi:acyl-[acyl-carrier-protein]-phospholipid O-acyltransferase/long-chain-fatty-acid--[acyl-carrier-protein] ligase